jgi:L-lactate dehydrogenase complex protein LldG
MSEVYKTSAAKEKMLKKIRKALDTHKVSIPFPEAEQQQGAIYTSQDDTPEMVFAEAFTALNGKFVFCQDETELVENLVALSDNMDWRKVYTREPVLLDLFTRAGLDFITTGDNWVEPDAGVTFCEALLARTGTVLISSRQDSGRMVSVYSPVHIVVAYRNQVLADIADGIDFLKKKYNGNLPSLINITTGPSRTADIEKTLVVGVHGPREIYVFYVDQ